MKPVSVGGVMIEHANLHNFKELHRKDIRKGDFVFIKRAGDVIPEVIESIKEKRRVSLSLFQEPKNCPHCKSLLKKEGELLRCISTQCSAIKERALIHFASKAAMNIEFLGNKNIQKFYQLGWLNKFSSFYKLPEKNISKLEGFGEKSFQLLTESLEKSKKLPYQKYYLL